MTAYSICSMPIAFPMISSDVTPFSKLITIVFCPTTVLISSNAPGSASCLLDTRSKSTSPASCGAFTSRGYFFPLIVSPSFSRRFFRSPLATTQKFSPNFSERPHIKYAPTAPAPKSATFSIFILILPFAPPTANPFQCFHYGYFEWKYHYP